MCLWSILLAKIANILPVKWIPRRLNASAQNPLLIERILATNQYELVDHPVYLPALTENDSFVCR
jgi:hypothetical protein